MTLAVLHIGSILRFLELWQGASTIAELVKRIMFGEIIAFSLVKRMKGNQNYFSEEKIKYKSNSLIGISYRLQGSLYMLLLNTQLKNHPFFLNLATLLINYRGHFILFNFRAIKNYMLVI